MTRRRGRPTARDVHTCTWVCSHAKKAGAAGGRWQVVVVAAAAAVCDPDDKNGRDVKNRGGAVFTCGEAAEGIPSRRGSDSKTGGGDCDVYK